MVMNSLSDMYLSFTAKLINPQVCLHWNLTLGTQRMVTQEFLQECTKLTLYPRVQVTGHMDTRQLVTWTRGKNTKRQRTIFAIRK